MEYLTSNEVLGEHLLSIFLIDFKLADLALLVA